MAAAEQGREPVALVQSVDRALSVLEILAKRGVAGVTEIAGELGVHKSTASRLVAVLESRGFVEQLADRGKYRLGFGIVRLAGALTVQRDLAHESRGACESLAADVGETVDVAILDGDRVINISEVRGPAAVASHNWVGQSTPPHATSSGKVLLAYGDGRRRRPARPGAAPLHASDRHRPRRPAGRARRRSGSAAGAPRSRSTSWA